jgi:hypothetical protein
MTELFTEFWAEFTFPEPQFISGIYTVLSSLSEEARYWQLAHMMHVTTCTLRYTFGVARQRREG